MDVATEIPIKPAPEVKSPSLQTPKEVKATTPNNIKQNAQARGVLEEIAKGTPVQEAISQKPEQLPDRETVTGLLSEANMMLLELRDMRLLVNSVATQAADTPLGNEVRISALRNILAIETQGLPPAAAAQLTKLQEKINMLNLSEQKPENSALLGVMTSYNESHPDKAIPQDVLDAVRSGTKDAASTVSQMLQTNNDLAQIAWKDITGIDGFTKLTPSPGIILDLAGIPKNPENMKKANEIFGSVKQMKAPSSDIGQNIMMGAMYGAMGLQFFMQIASPESSGGGGH